MPREEYQDRKKRSRKARDEGTEKIGSYEERKRRALAEGEKTLFATCPLCGLNRPLKRWGKEIRFVVKPDYSLVQARYSRGYGSGFFLNENESLSIEEVREEYPDLYKNLKRSIGMLYKLFK